MALFIGIDPGVNTGFAVWNAVTRKLERVETTTIVDAMASIREIDESVPQVIFVIFEDARLRKWLPREVSNSEYRGKLMGAGSVKRDCEIWQEFCEMYHYEYTAIPPRKGLTKWTAESFARVTGWKGRTSNHARDAAMLVFGK